MTQTDTEMLIAELISGQSTATAGILDRALSSTDPILLVAAALIGHAPIPPRKTDLMSRAAAYAATTRDRQVVVIASAHLAGESDRVNDLAREHLVDYPDSVLVAWLASIAGDPLPSESSQRTTPKEKS